MEKGNLPVMLHRLYIPLYGSQTNSTLKHTSVLEMFLSHLFFSEKETYFTNERALHQSDRASLCKFKASVLGCSSEEKTPKTKMLYFLK